MENIILLLILAIVLPVGAFFLSAKKTTSFKRTLFLNIVSFFGMLVIANVFMFQDALAETVNSVNNDAGIEQGLKFLAVALSTGLATVGAGIATGQVASSALGAISEDPSFMGKALIFVALSEGIAIYGLLISFMILNG